MKNKTLSVPKTMTIEFDNVLVKINNPTVQKRVWNLILDLKREKEFAKNNHQWTPEEDDVLRTLVDQNASPKDMEEYLQRSIKAINMRRYLLGIDKKRVEKMAVDTIEIGSTEPKEEIEL